jgi:hypothetical protein
VTSFPSIPQRRFRKRAIAFKAKAFTPKLLAFYDLTKIQERLETHLIECASFCFDPLTVLHQSHPMAAMLSTRKATEQAWKSHKKIIRDLYLNQDKTLEQVMEYMQETCAFNAR